MAAAAAVASLCSLQHAVLLCEGKCRGTREGSERYNDDTPLLLSFSHVALSSVEIRTPKESDVHDRFLYSKGEYNCKNIHLILAVQLYIFYFAQIFALIFVDDARFIWNLLTVRLVLNL